MQYCRKDIPGQFIFLIYEMKTICSSNVSKVTPTPLCMQGVFFTHLWSFSLKFKSRPANVSNPKQNLS